MAAFTSRSLNLPRATRAWIAPIGGGAAGIAVATLCALMPQTTLEDWIWRTGLPTLIAAAEPPLGGTARIILALGIGTLAAAVAWSALFLLFGTDGLLAPRPRVDAGVPVLRRADAHPDAPARRPMSAADLGTPLPPPQPPSAPDAEVRVAAWLIDAIGDTLPEDQEAAPAEPLIERAIPADLDIPLAAFHPDAVPDVPREPVRPVTPLRMPMPLNDGERIAAVELPREPTDTEGSPSIEALLKRLEQSARRPVRARA